MPAVSAALEIVDGFEVDKGSANVNDRRIVVRKPTRRLAHLTPAPVHLGVAAVNGTMVAFPPAGQVSGVSTDGQDYFGEFGTDEGGGTYTVVRLQYRGPEGFWG